MANRGIFAVSLWESLSPDLKNRVTNDIAWGDPHETEKLRRVLSAKPESVRKELRAALLKTGRSPKEIEHAVGPGTCNADKIGPKKI